MDAAATASNFFLIPQAQPVSSIVYSFWQRDEVNSFKTETIIPRGIVEIIFNFSDAAGLTMQLNNKQYALTKCFINGFNTHSIQLSLPEKQVFFGVRFHPAMVKNIFGVAPGEFANVAIDLTLIDASVALLWHELFEQPTFSSRVTVFSNWVSSRLLPVSNRDVLLNHFLTNTSHVIPSVPQLSAALCYSPRHLSRKIYALTGMNTEELLAYKKFLLSTRLLHTSDMSLTQLAYACQFADQSHFIKTFKSFSLLTPGEYKKANIGLEGHIYEDVR